ncbi:MAG: O-acetyl-ADP-ribose deacetylase [Candidatus Bathyarchaeia archaeon]
MEWFVKGVKLRLIQGDITDQDVDAIVNAANPSLLGGGGVDGAIHRKAGPKILEECRRIRSEQWPEGLPTGKAVMTSGGNLKARYVIHTVGPIWRGGGAGERDLLADAYRNSLELAVLKGLRTVSFPSISTGAYGYPIEEAAKIAVKTVKDFLEQKADTLREVNFVLFTASDLKIYEEAATGIFGS